MQPADHITPAQWAAFREGDRDAYGCIYRQFYPRLYNYGRQFTPDTAVVEDAIQEVFTWCWTHRSKLGEVREFRSYLFVAFRHGLLRAMREGGAAPAGWEQEADFRLEPAADQRMMDDERERIQREHLRAALERLTGRQKEAVFFRFYEGMSYEEIAGVLDISVKGAYKIVARALAALRAYGVARQASGALLSLLAAGALFTLFG